MIDPNIDEQALEISFTCASSYPYERYDWMTDRPFIERLMISDEAIDMTRLNGGASVLKNHDTDKVLGKVVRAWVEDGALCVRIKFRSDNMSRDLFNDLAAGTVPNVSIGYTYKREDCSEYTDRDGNLIREVNKWEAYEVSVCVGIPADPTVGFYRSFALSHNDNAQTLKKEEPKMRTREDELNPSESEEVSAMKARIAELESENERLKKEAEKPEEPAAQEKACGGEEDKTRQMFVDAVANNIRSMAFPYIKPQERAYNMTNVLAALAGRKVDVSYEMERSDAIFESLHQAPSKNSIMVPFDGFRSVLTPRETREMNAAAGSAPGLVAQENLPDMFVEYVRNRIGVKNATFIPGLTGGPVTIPTQTTDTTVAWVSGGTQTTDTNATLSSTSLQVGSITLNPHKLGAYVDVGLDLLLMGNPAATSIAVRSLLAGISHKLGTTMLKGNASNPTITGLATASGVQTQVISNIASATWQNLLSMIGKVEGLEFDGVQEWVMGPSDKATLKGIAKGSYGSGFICEDDMIDGRRVHVDGSLSSGDIYYGDFSNIYVGQWGGVELMLDPYTQATAGSVRVIVRLVCDIGIARPSTFVKRVQS